MLMFLISLLVERSASHAVPESSRLMVHAPAAFAYLALPPTDLGPVSRVMRWNPV